MTIPGHFVPANRAAASKAARFICRWQRFAAFPSTSPTTSSEQAAFRALPPSAKAHTTPLVLPLPTEPASLGFGVDPWLVTGERRPWIAVGASAPYGYRVPLAGKGGWV